MSFGKNLQFLRKMRNKMTQEELAEKLGVSRQTISKWELDVVYPEINKVVELCQFFSCSMDQLIRDDLNMSNDAYSDIRIEEVDDFRYIRYAVISGDPEKDAIQHVRELAESQGTKNPEIIGWDFPYVTQEQMSVYHMHGYAAAWILPKDANVCEGLGIISQKKHRYAVITIKDPFQAAFQLIPNAYQVLMSYIKVNGLGRECKECLSCFEKEYDKENIHYMDVYIAID